MVGGGEAVYAVSEIERLGFEGGDTLVVVTSTGTTSYAPETIRRIEDAAEAARLVSALRLFQNQPNPFSPETRAPSTCRRPAR